MSETWAPRRKFQIGRSTPKFTEGKRRRFFFLRFGLFCFFYFSTIPLYFSMFRFSVFSDVPPFFSSGARRGSYSRLGHWHRNNIFQFFDLNAKKHTQRILCVRANAQIAAHIGALSLSTLSKVRRFSLRGPARFGEQFISEITRIFLPLVMCGSNMNVFFDFNCLFEI